MRVPRREDVYKRVHGSVAGYLGEDAAESLAGSVADLFVPNMSVVCYGDDGFMERYRAAFDKIEGDDLFAPLTTKQFPNRELWAKVDHNVRRKRTYVVLNFLGYEGEFDPNIGLMRLLIINDALRRASVAEITDVLPFLPYLRQDRKDESRVPITAKLLANLLTVSGANRVVTFDMHADQEQGFFDIPVDNLTALELFADYFFGKDGIMATDDVAVASAVPEMPGVVSPDAGAMPRNLRFKRICDRKYGTNLRVAMLEKRKGEDTGRGVRDRRTEVFYLVGEEHVRDRYVIMVDDMIGTATTACKGTGKLREKGAKRVYIAATHGLFSPREEEDMPTAAEDKLGQMGIGVVTTDTIPRSTDYLKQHPGITMLYTAEMLARATSATDRGDSVSKMFEWE